MSQYEMMIEAMRESQQDRRETDYPAREALEWEPEPYNVPVDVVFRRTRWINK